MVDWPNPRLLVEVANLDGQLLVNYGPGLLRQGGEERIERRNRQANCSCTVIFRPHTFYPHVYPLTPEFLYNYIQKLINCVFAFKLMLFWLQSESKRV